MKCFLLSVLIACISTASFAQGTGTVFIEDSSIKAYNGAIQKQLAWSGGFNNPQFTMGDLNNDQIADMVVYDFQSNQIKTFLNKGTPGNPNYVYAPKYAKNFPAANNYLIMADYNRDGISDVFNKGGGGIRAHKGYFNAANELCFTMYKELRYASDPGFTINANVNGGDIPSFVDVDNDGDLDFFAFNEGGAIIYFFKNCQVEHGLPKDTIEVCKPTNCWGYVNQGNIRKFTTSVTVGDGVYCPAYYNFDCRGTRHGGNTACVLDLDGDGDYDFLGGNFAFNDLQMLTNGKAQYGSKDSIVAQDTIWRGYEMANWPAAFNVDADGDGKKDILVSPHGVNLSENYRNIAFFRNTGTTTAPVFVLQTDTFLTDRGIDVGTGAYPVIYDYNKDGRPDLFVGTAGYYQPNGLFRSKIAYYRNTLENGVTKLMLQTTDFNNLFARNVEGAAPAFGDLNNDGKDDLIVGHVDGTITFYQNTAASNSVVPIYAAGVTLKDRSNNNVRIQNFAAPYIYDINKDGKADLLIGSQLSTIGLYTSAGGLGGLPLLDKTTDTLGGMRATPSSLFGYGSIYVGKMDSTGKDFILIGNVNGTFRRYTGFESGNINMSYQLLDAQYSGIDVGDRSTAAIGDLDRDGKYELIAGNLLGGLNQFRQSAGDVSSGVVQNRASAGECNVYPNPATDVIYLTWDNKFAGNGPVNAKLINITGQSVAATTFNGGNLMGVLQIGNYPPGIYVCLVQAGNNILSQRIVIKK